MHNLMNLAIQGCKPVLIFDKSLNHVAIVGRIIEKALDHVNKQFRVDRRSISITIK